MQNIAIIEDTFPSK